MILYVYFSINLHCNDACKLVLFRKSVFFKLQDGKHLIMLRDKQIYCMDVLHQNILLSFTVAVRNYFLVEGQHLTCFKKVTYQINIWFDIYIFGFNIFHCEYVKAENIKTTFLVVIFYCE